MRLAREELIRLVTGPESPRVERKRALTHPDEVRKAICAFANDLGGTGEPGYAVIGLEDDGSPAGTPIDDGLLLKLAGMRDDGKIQPRPSLVAERVTLDVGAAIAVVEVLPFEAPPVRLDGVTWVRTGPRNAIATREEEHRLSERRLASSQPFDLRPCPGSTLADLDLGLFQQEYLPNAVAPSVLAENRRTVEQQLLSLRLLDPSGVPTHAGVLLLGKDPAWFLPGAYLQFVRFDGPSVADPIKASRRFTGPLGTVARELDAFLALNTQTARVPVAGTMRYEEVPDYPHVAMRELAFNALIHRSYDFGNAPARIFWLADRVEVLSPGGLYGYVNDQNFRHTTSYRNPTLAEGMRVLGFVERYGIGMGRIHESLAKNGNPPPEFRFEPSQFFCAVRGAR